MSTEIKHTKGEWIASIELQKDAAMCPIPYFEISSHDTCAWIAHLNAGGIISEEQSKANAAFICKAVNNHAKLLEALHKIANWELPESGSFWDNDKKDPMSYEAAFGSNGVRDYIKSVAKAAIKEAEL